MQILNQIQRKRFFVGAAILLIIGTGAVVFLLPSYEPFPSEALPGVSIGQHLPPEYGASGLVWHSRLQNFFLVSDGGIVSSMCDQGETLSHWDLPGDLEAVTVACPQSNFIYIGNEYPDQIREFCLSTKQVTRTFDLTPWMQGPNNRGLEALTFVPDAADAEGGLFYAGLQDTGEIFVFRLPLLSCTTSTDVTHIKTIPPINGVDDLSALFYKTSHDVIYAVYDDENLLRALKTDGTLIREWALPGDDQEGISLRGTELFISVDGKEVGDVIRYAPFRGIHEPILTN